jgi:hypothetical protein
MDNIYIGGDSYCFQRQHDTDWPYVLSKKLNLNLTGQGFPGRGFWRTRLDLIRYLEDADNLKNTKLFVFCHTSPYRMLSSTYAWVPNFTLPNEPPNKNEVAKMYYKYLYEEQIHNWAMERWFIELNELLAEKTVIHLFCFSDAKKLSDRLNGYKLKESLHYKSVQLDNLHNENNTEERINHFTKSFNVNFANSLANYYTNEILPNPMQTKYFDIVI